MNLQNSTKTPLVLSLTTSSKFFPTRTFTGLASQSSGTSWLKRWAWKIRRKMKGFHHLSSNIHIQILQTCVHTFSSWINEEKLIKDQSTFPMMIILLILITFCLDDVFVMLGENWYWSLMGLKGLIRMCTSRTQSNLI